MSMVQPDAVHYMNYSKSGISEEVIIKTFSGMIRYTCNNLEGNFDIERAASALGVTIQAVEILLYIFEEIGMIKIHAQNENVYQIKFISAVEITKAFHTEKYAEFKEILHSVYEYKEHLMSMEI